MTGTNPIVDCFHHNGARDRQKAKAAGIICAVLLFSFVAPQRAGAAAPPANPPEPVVVGKGTSTIGGLKETITVVAQGLSAYLAAQPAQPPKFVLYLNGIALHGLQTSTPMDGHDHIMFYLDRTDANRDGWALLFHDPSAHKLVSLSMGLEGGHAFDTKVWDFTLVMFRGWWLVWWCFLFALLLGLFLWMAAESDIIRETGPPPRPDKNGKIPRKAFSLARTQMAWWTFLVIAGFILIWMVTWDSAAIPASVLALIGISAATGLAGAVVDKSNVGSLVSEQSQLSSEKDGLQAEITALRTQLAAPPAGTIAANIQAGIDTKTARVKAIDDRLTEIAAQVATPGTEGFFIDILSDATGLSFYRFQMFAWTFVLGIIFAASVVRELVMLDFSTTLLGLMGVSSGTYIGFKLPEQKNPS